MKRSKTNSGFLYFFEKIVRCHPLLYFVARYLIRYTNIFEEDANGVSFLNLNKRVNIIDVGASDGIASKFFLNNLSVKKIYCFEPDKTYVKILQNLKKKQLIIKPYGIGIKNFESDIFMPRYRFLKKNYDLTTYSFFDKFYLNKQINLDFKFRKNISIIKKKIHIKKINKINTNIDLIKIDTNGYEMQVIKGLKSIISYSKPVIILETNQDILKIKNFLKEHSYNDYYYDVKEKKLKRVKKKYPLNTFFLQKKHLKTN
jgi:FkbM family methyltransferase